jgi:hypothetical protein
VALAETAKLVAKLSLDSRAFQQGMTRANRSVSTLGKSAKRVGGAVGKTMAAGAAVAAGIIAVNVKSGVESLATLESAVTSVDGAIKQMGITGKVTGTQIAGWANEIEASVQAAFDDKEITAATTSLIRYGSVAPENLRRAMVVMTDLAVKTGSVESASNLLARALADPAKGMARLTRVGITLTAAEQKRITKLVKHGKVTKAQAELLGILETRTKGAAAAMNGPWNDALKMLGESVDDAQRALAIGFMPVLQRTSEWLTVLLRDHEGDIRNFGQQLAGAFDKLLTFVQGIDWKRVGDGLKMAADFAGKLIGAFTSLPPEAQATILALAGLNKLSGGAVTGAIGGLAETVGKIIGKGLQTIFAANVTVVGKNVTGAPGVGGKGGKGSPVGTVAKGAGAAGLASAAVGIGAGVGVGGALGLGMFYGLPMLVNSIFGRTGGNDQKPFKAAGGEVTGSTAGIVRLFTPALKQMEAEQRRTTAAVQDTNRQRSADERKYAGETQQTITREQGKALVAFRAGERASQAGNRLQQSANSKLDAIRAKKQNVAVTTNVSVQQAISVSSITGHQRYRQAVSRSSTIRSSPA